MKVYHLLVDAAVYNADARANLSTRRHLIWKVAAPGNARSPKRAGRAKSLRAGEQLVFLRFNMHLSQLEFLGCEEFARRSVSSCISKRCESFLRVSGSFETLQPATHGRPRVGQPLSSPYCRNGLARCKSSRSSSAMD